MTRGPVLGSALVHVGVVAVLLIARGRAPLVIPGPEVVQVALLDANMRMPPAVATPPPREPMPEVPPTDEDGVRIEPRKPKPQPAPVKPVEQAPETAAPRPALPFAAVGPPGLKGEVSVDATDFEFTYYLMLVRNRIAQSWTPPGGGQGAHTVVYFRITRGGAIAGPRIEQGSGVDFFDQAALRAVVLSDPLPPLPLGWSGSELGVHFGFEYSGP